eukprot:TRINITY_DN183_c0_g1_i5.p1 TRINITY_DN183_c0_g1~~TRINITY_DN183_c0_g1_i5.p1  ORF type:complete len:385 (+),score=136.29 TRINITY_DN183_c0_g1_i5:73-1155(+)
MQRAALLVLAALAAEASTGVPMEIMVKNWCGSPLKNIVYTVEGRGAQVCGAMFELDEARKTCRRGTQYECYIPKCFSNGEAVPLKDGKAVPPCDVNPAAIDPTVPVPPKTGNGAGLVPDTTVTTSFVARALTNLPNSQGLREGWPDIPNSAFLNYPQSLVNRLGQIPNVYIDNTFEIRFACTSGGADDKCDLFAFIYRCPPCTFSNGGDFTSKLLADGWEPYSCDVKFQLDQTVPTHEHSTLVYHRQMDKHDMRETDKWYTIKADSLLELSWFATSRATAHCSDHDGDEAMCMTDLPDECQWDAQTQSCNRVLCPAKSQGPDRVHLPGPNGNPSKPKGPWVQKCKVCVDEERDMYMPNLK